MIGPFSGFTRLRTGLLIEASAVASGEISAPILAPRLADPHT